VASIESRIEENAAAPMEGEVRSLLLEAIAGLDELDAGGIPEIFHRKKQSGWYGGPPAIQRMKLEALGYVALLRRMGDPKSQDFSALSARNLVSNDYGFGPYGGETIRGWEKEFKKTRPSDLLEAKRVTRGLYNGWRYWSTLTGKELLLRAIKRAGDRYKSALVAAKESAGTPTKQSQGKN